MQWDTFTFIVYNGFKKSLVATVTIVPPSGNIVGSNFLLSHEDWTVYGNKAITLAQFEPYSRGPALNHYILATDDKINVQRPGGEDSSLWYFNAPSKFLGNQGIAYGGSLTFTLSGFSGDYQKTNGDVCLFSIWCMSFINNCIGKFCANRMRKLYWSHG